VLEDNVVKSLKLENTYVYSNNIGEQGRTDSAWKRGTEGEREGLGVRERSGPNNVCTYE
jgi:hypothetical protein